MGIYQLTERLALNFKRVPLLRRILAADYRRYFATRPPNRFSGAYPTFAAAESSISASQRSGYDHSELVSMYRDRMDKACESDYGPLFWLRGIVEPGTRVFDFGGHVGVSYYGWRKYLGYPDGLTWTVCDVPAIAKGGAQLAAERGQENLYFTSDFSRAADCDVLLAAGSLQYVEPSLRTLLESLDRLPQHVIVSKLPMHDGEAFVTVQSTGRAFHAYRIFNRAEFVGDMATLGYHLVDDWVNREQHCEIPFHGTFSIAAYSGMYFSLNGAR